VDAGVTVPDGCFRRPSRLLSQILPGGAALLALACVGLAALPFVLEPLPVPPQVANDVAKKQFEAAFVAPDRLAPLRRGARAPLTLAFCYAVFGCLFAANVWMLPRLQRLTAVPGSSGMAAAILAVLVILLATAAFVALGVRPVLAAARLLGGRYGEGYDEDGLARFGIELWWVLSGGVLLLLDVTLLATVTLAGFRIGGAALLPRGQVAPVRVDGLWRLRWLGAGALGCFVAYVALLAVPTPVGSPMGAKALPAIGQLAAGVGGVALTWLFGIAVFEWMPRHLQADAPPAAVPPPRSQAIQQDTAVGRGVKAPEPDRG
jgi:hypothetical protein